MNMAFHFNILNPETLKNLICLSLEDINSDKYVICDKIEVLQDKVICTC